jgi:hypothetical protein
MAAYNDFEMLLLCLMRIGLPNMKFFKLFFIMIMGESYK